ncbi:hypothetical protein AAER62_05940, partial [Acinetobacter baumannii]
MNGRGQYEEVAAERLCGLIQKSRILNDTGSVHPSIHGRNPERRAIHFHAGKDIFHIPEGRRPVIYRCGHGILMQL